jgi:hypothetical protein
MIRYRIPALLVLLLVLADTRDARADLIDYGNGLIYDTVQDLTWLDPYFMSAPHGPQYAPNDGSFCDSFRVCDWYYTYAGATQWVSELTYGGYDDWRLPDRFLTGIGDPGYGDNEWHRALAQLPGWEFEVDSLDTPVDVITAGSQGPFQLQPNYLITWMDEPLIYTSFSAGGGYDFPDDTDTFTAEVRAVRSGRPTSVPEPATVALIALGATTMAIRRRRK